MASRPRRRARPARWVRAENARDALGARRASKAPFYVWSLRPLKIEAFIHDLLCEIHFTAGDAKAGLAAAQHAQEVDGDQTRGGRIAWILCHQFPEREEEAFEQAYRYAEFGGYEAVTALPGYAAYAERRKRRVRPDKGWRWGGRSEPASDATLREAERKLGIALPKDFRRFLETPQRSELLLRIDDRTTTLRFFPAAQLVRSVTLCSSTSLAPKSPPRPRPISVPTTACRCATSCRSPSRSI